MPKSDRGEGGPGHGRGQTCDKDCDVTRKESRNRHSNTTQNPEFAIFWKNTKCHKEAKHPKDPKPGRRVSVSEALYPKRLPLTQTGQTPRRHMLTGRRSHHHGGRDGENPAARPLLGLCLPLTPRGSTCTWGSSDVSPENVGTKRATCVLVPTKRHVGKEETLSPGARRLKVRLW